VIPCRDEPDPVATLSSLAQCQPPAATVEVIVVVNGSDGDPPEVQQHNLHSLETLASWAETCHDSFFKLSLQYHPHLPQRQAGVGLARRLGMDEAAQRLLHARQADTGIIVALDADCRVAPNYFIALENHFSNRPETVGASIYFEHPLEHLTPRHRAGIVGYELFLRIHLQGLRHAGSPHAFHTVGSAMAVRAGVYRRVGGMNRRQAGEDFYFLQKVMAHGPFSDLTTTTVFPSPRISHRVPFGTGRAMGQWHQNPDETYTTYDPCIYSELRTFFMNAKETLHLQGDLLAHASTSLVSFLEQQQFAAALEEMRANTSSLDSLMKRFHLWFNPFRLLKFVHFATERYHPRVPVTQGAVTLLEQMGISTEGCDGHAEQSLMIFRKLDRLAP